MLCRCLLLLPLVISACGTQAIDSHQQEKVTEVRFKVVKGSVYTASDKAVQMTMGNLSFKVLTKEQRHNFSLLSDYPIALDRPGFLDDDDDFYFHGASSPATVSAIFSNYTLHSVYQGLPMPILPVTLTQDWDWHGSNKLKLSMRGDMPAATISINPFSNLAYWLWIKDGSKYASYEAARDKVNELLALPATCHFEEKLCKSHLSHLEKGVEITANADSFTITRPGNTPCSGPLSQFGDCPL